MHIHGLSVGVLGLCVSLVGLGSARADRGERSKKQKSYKYQGAHPLSAQTEDGFCYIEVPHVHATNLPNKHRSLYRDHRGHHSFVADPVAYGYDGPRHSYYGHHPVAVEVVLGENNSYASGQQLEYCYLDGPHFHLFEPPAGLHFESKAGASWYIGELPEAYVEGKGEFAPVNRVYATLEVERPEVVFEEPPVGYVGPILDVHVVVPGAAVVVEPVGVEVQGHGRGHGHADVHGEIRAGIEIRVPSPRIEIGVSVPGIVVGGDHHHDHGKKHKHKSKSKSKHKGRPRPHW